MSRQDHPAQKYDDYIKQHYPPVRITRRERIRWRLQGAWQHLRHGACDEFTELIDWLPDPEYYEIDRSQLGGP